MNYKSPASLVLSFILLQTVPLGAHAGGSTFVEVGRGLNVSTGVAVSRGRSRASIFIRFGSLWIPYSGVYYVPPIAESYNAVQGQFGSSGLGAGLYINGYRVLPSGWLRVQVEPRDAEVLVDGFPISTEKTSGMSTSMGFFVGKHRVEARKEGLRTYQTELEVQPAREVLLQVTLDR